MAYDLKTVYDYIWGNYIEEEYIEELENNPSFMLEVIKRTKDKKMYELCSDKVKSDYTFVREVVFLFKDDLVFSTTVAREYLDSRDFPEDDVSVAELNIIMSNLYGKIINEFALRAAVFYEIKKVEMEICLDSADLELKQLSKSGFIFAESEFSMSDIIVDYIAKRMLREALYGEKYNNLEYLIHKNFKSLHAFKKNGEINFLREVISDYDLYLANYSFNPNRVEKFNQFYGKVLKDIKRIEQGWDSYMDRLNCQRIEIFNSEMNKYIMEHGVSGTLSYDDIISYIANKVGVVSVFEKFEPDFVFQDDEDIYNVLEIKDADCISYGICIAKKLFSIDVIDDSYDEYDEKSNKKYTDNCSNLFEDNDAHSAIIRFQLTDKKSIGKK